MLVCRIIEIKDKDKKKRKKTSVVLIVLEYLENVVFSDKDAEINKEREDLEQVKRNLQRQVTQIEWVPVCLCFSEHVGLTNCRAVGCQMQPVSSSLELSQPS